MPLSPVTGLPRGHLTMLLAHRAMVTDLDRVQRTAQGLVTTPNPLRAEALGHYTDLVARVVHHHHQGEDEFLWPRLREHGADPAALELLTAEHATLTPLVTAWHEAIARGAFDSDAAAHLSTLTAELHAHLSEHTADEERELLGRLAPALDARVWKDFEKHMRTTAPLWTLRFMPAWLLSVAGPDDLGGVPALPIARTCSGWLRRTRRAAFGEDY